MFDVIFFIVGVERETNHSKRKNSSKTKKKKNRKRAYVTLGNSGDELAYGEEGRSSGKLTKSHCAEESESVCLLISSLFHPKDLTITNNLSS